MRFEPTSTFRAVLYLLGAILAAVCVFLFVGWPMKTPNVTYGMTFSRPYAEQDLGLNGDHVLQVALDDVGIRRFRLSAYWKLLEPKEGEWDFTQLDADIAEIDKRGGKVILAIGDKLPRWPECWQPDWEKRYAQEKQRQLTLNYLEKIVTRYRNTPAIVAWQVENEPHFRYGDCPAPDYLFIQQETQFVHGLDPTRPMTTTDSGELSTWLTLGVFVDKLGISTYRLVRNPIIGDHNFYYWFLPPYFYERKSLLLRPFGVKDIYVSEFQMEPWSNKALTDTPVADQLTSMNLKQMQANFSYAERMGIPEVDFWGIEWWVWMKEKAGHPEFLEAARAFWQSH